MPKRNVYMMIGVIVAFVAGIFSWAIWGSSPVIGEAVLIVGLLGFFVMIVSNLFLKGRKTSEQ